MRVSSISSRNRAPLLPGLADFLDQFLVVLEGLDRDPARGVRDFEQLEGFRLFGERPQVTLDLVPVRDANLAHLGMLVFGHPDDRFQQFADAAPLVAHREDRRGAQKGPELFEVDPCAGLVEGVGHVQGEHDLRAQLQELRRQEEVSFEVARVDHVHDHVRLFVDDEPAGHDLLDRVGGQAVGARQVHDRDLAAVEGGVAFLLLDRHTGPVSHVMSGAGDGVEQGRLARVRVAGQRDSKAFCLFHCRVSGWKNGVRGPAAPLCVGATRGTP